MAKKINYKLIKFYLILFLAYILIGIIDDITTYLYFKKYGFIEDPFIFGFFGEAIIGFIFISFILFNLSFLVWSMIKKYPLLLKILSLSEIIYLLVFILGIDIALGLSTSPSLVTAPPLKDYIFPNIINIIQLVFIILIFRKIKK